MNARQFDPAQVLPRNLYSLITDIRVQNPGLPKRVAQKRTRRRVLAPDGRLVLLAADHPARMVTEIRGEGLGMADRHGFLARVVRVMGFTPFDGLLGTADVLDEVLILEHIMKRPQSLVDGKVLIGSVNRGGLAGTAFEMDDFTTGYDVDGIVRMSLDGAKFLLRLDPDDPNSSKTLRYCVETARQCDSRRIPLFLEPLPVTRSDGRVKTVADKERLIKIVGMASALGSSSTRVWLKLPFCEGFDEVASSTTLPILLLGGEATDDASKLLREVNQAMKAGPNVRGVLLGRNLLFPPGGDPLPLALAVHSIVHGKTSLD